MLLNKNKYSLISLSYETYIYPIIKFSSISQIIIHSNLN